MVVFCRAPAAGGALEGPHWPGPARRPSRGRPPNSPSISKGAAQKVRPSGAVTEPQLLTQTRAPTAPSAERMEAEPVPPFRPPAVAP